VWRACAIENRNVKWTSISRAFVSNECTMYSRERDLLYVIFNNECAREQSSGFVMFYMHLAPQPQVQCVLELSRGCRLVCWG
jgi:hypothetical protein